METYQATLVNKTLLPGDVDLLRFTLDSTTPLTFTPGQYVVLTVPCGASSVKRLYSIASSAMENTAFELIIKRVPGGIASEYIDKFTVGQKIEFQGPAGVFTLKNTPNKKVFLTTGTGIAPIRSFLLSNKSATLSYHLFWGLQSYKEVYLFDELKKLCLQNPLLKVSVCLSKEQDLGSINEADRSFFCLGHIDVAVERILSDGYQNSLEYYVCGRREVVESIREYLYNHNIDRSMVYFERY